MKVLGAPCTCANASLCAPLARTEGPETYVFHVAYRGDAVDWRNYDWEHITTM